MGFSGRDGTVSGSPNGTALSYASAVVAVQHNPPKGAGSSLAVVKQSSARVKSFSVNPTTAKVKRSPEISSEVKSTCRSATTHILSTYPALTEHLKLCLSGCSGVHYGPGTRVSNKLKS